MQCWKFYIFQNKVIKAKFKKIQQFKKKRTHRKMQHENDSQQDSLIQASLDHQRVIITYDKLQKVEKQIGLHAQEFTNDKAPNEEKHLKQDQESSDENDSNNQVLKDFTMNQHNDSTISTDKARLEEYLKYVFNMDLDPSQGEHKYLQQVSSQLSQIQRSIIQNGRFKRCTQYAPQIVILSIQPTKYYQITVIQVQYGFYKTIITILNVPSIEEKSPLHSHVEVSGFGTFGDVYLVGRQRQLYAVKCINTAVNETEDQNYFLQQKSEFIIDAIKEYFFLCLFSQLRIGPQAKQFLGFDLLVFKDCIEFSMELCTPPTANEKTLNQLKQDMKIMHLLKIVHRDIKSDNIMNSRQLNKPVFIDFGGCTFINQNIGQRSRTRFIGTTGFSSLQMLKILNEKQGFVDLYYNDMHCLKKSFFFFRNLQQNKFQQKQSQMNQPSAEFDVMKNAQLIHYLIKFHLHNKDFKQYANLVTILQSQHGQDLQAFDYKQLKFLIDIQPNSSLGKIYWGFDSQIRSLTHFESLKDIYTSQLPHITFVWVEFPFKRQQFASTVLAYKMLGIVHGNLNQIERQIQLILMSEASVLNYLRDEGFSKGQSFSCQELYIYCLVAINYCAVANNRYKVPMQDKIQMSHLVVKALRRNDRNIASKYLSLLFECPYKDLIRIAIIFQFFVFEIFPFVPQRFKRTSMKYSISTLSLLGYPFYLDDAKRVILYQFVRWKAQTQQNKSKGTHQLSGEQIDLSISYKIKKILRFWQAFALFLVDSNTFYSRIKQNFKMQRQDLQFIKRGYLQFQQQIITPPKGNQNQLLIVNYHFYLLICKFQSAQYNQQIVSQAIAKLQSSQFSSKEDKQLQAYYWQWKKYIFLITHILEQQIITENSQESFLVIYKMKINMLQVNDLELSIGIYIMNLKIKCHLGKIQKFLKIIDARIDCDDISERYFVHYRIYIACKFMNLDEVKRLSQIAYKQTQQISLFNFQNLSCVLLSLHQILISQRQGWWNNVMQKLGCLNQLQKIINRGKQYIDYFLLIQNTNQGDSVLKQKKIYGIQNGIKHAQTQKITLNKKQLIQIFRLLKKVISVLAIVWSYSRLLINQNQNNYVFIKVKYDQNQTTYYDNFNVARFLQQNFTSKQMKSLFFSSELRAELHVFLQKSIKQLYSKDFFTQDKSIQLNSKILILLTIVDYQNQNRINQLIEGQLQECLTIQKLINKQLQFQPCIRILTIFFVSKIQANNLKIIKDYMDLIKFYEHYARQLDNSYLMFETNLMNLVFNGYIYCGGSCQVMYKYVLNMTRLLEHWQNYAIQVFINIVKGKFCSFSQQSTTWKQSFTIFPQNWKPLQFIQYLYSKIKQNSYSNQSYMPLIYYFALQNIDVPVHIKKSFFIFIIRSLEYLKPIARDFIFQKIYAYAYDVKAAMKGIIQPGFFLSGSQGNKFLKRMDADTAKLLYFYTEKYLKRQDYSQNIQKLIQKRYNLKKKTKSKWEMPNFIEKIYRKKLFKYHAVRGGFNDINKNQIKKDVDLKSYLNC